MRYKAFFFDFDGVITDSVEVKTRAFAQLFKAFGPEIQEKVVAHHRANGGMTRKDKFIHYHKEYLNEPLDTGGLDSLCRRFSFLVVDEVVASDYQAATDCGVHFLGILPGPEAPLLKIAPDIKWARDFTEVDFL